MSAESSLTQVLVLYVPAWFPVELGHVMTLLCEVLDEHFLRIILSVPVEEMRMKMEGSWSDSHTVANVIANAALFEQTLMSGSTAMIFLTLDTV